MTQKLLDRSQVRTPLEEVGRERVPERVRVDPGLGCGVPRPDPQAAANI